MKKVEQWSLGYNILRPIGWIVHRLVHKHITINGRENLPINEPVIMAPNHQNALLDAVAVIVTTHHQPVFLGRADIFKKNPIARILNFLKISPVYRIRDGKDTLGNNKEIFDNCVRLLKKKKTMCLFPEGAHIGMKSMLPHKKAIPRIVFLAAQKTDFELDVQIVPIGLNYSHYYKFRRNLTINFGKPLHSKDYYELYKKEGEQRASIVMRNDLFDAMKKLVIHVPDKKIYTLYDQAFELIKKPIYALLGLKNNSKNFFKAEQYITQQLQKQLEEKSNQKEVLNEKAEKYKRLKEKLNIEEKELQLGIPSIGELLKIVFITIITFPIALYGATIHGWLFYITRYPYRSKIKDKQFYSTFSYAFSFILFPLWVTGLFFILNTIFQNGYTSLILDVLSIPCGLIAWELGQLLKRTYQRLRINHLKKHDQPQYVQLIQTRNELLEFYEPLIKK